VKSFKQLTVARNVNLRRDIVNRLHKKCAATCKRGIIQRWVRKNC